MFEVSCNAYVLILTGTVHYKFVLIMMLLLMMMMMMMGMNCPRKTCPGENVGIALQCAIVIFVADGNWSVSHWTPLRLDTARFIAPMTALICLNLVIIVGNVMVIMAVFTHSKLRSMTTNKFIVSLAVADLMVGLVVLPFSSANEVSTLPLHCMPLCYRSESY